MCVCVVCVCIVCVCVLYLCVYVVAYVLPMFCLTPCFFILFHSIFVVTAYLISKERKEGSNGGRRESCNKIVWELEKIWAMNEEKP